MSRLDQLYEMITVETDDCIEWPYARFRSGYGQVSFHGRPSRAHRLSLIRASGSEPVARDAAHSCRNRACVNPRHLRWATRSENNLDKRRDGTDLRGERHPSARLTDEDANHIRESTETGVTLAKKYGVSRSIIYAIKQRRTYNSVGSPT